MEWNGGRARRVNAWIFELPITCVLVLFVAPSLSSVNCTTFKGYQQLTIYKGGDRVRQLTKRPSLTEPGAAVFTCENANGSYFIGVFWFWYVPTRRLSVNKSLQYAGGSLLDVIITLTVLLRKQSKTPRGVFVESANVPISPVGRFRCVQMLNTLG